jgi:hypothetical protein
VGTVKAYPRKQFFIEMFTRDITLEDCILDLIDNAMDSYLRTRKIDVGAEVFGQSGAGAVEHPGEIKIDFSKKEFRISDNCGGIDRKAADDDVFCFGHARGSKQPAVWVSTALASNGQFSSSATSRSFIPRPPKAVLMFGLMSRPGLSKKKTSGLIGRFRSWIIPRRQAHGRQAQRSPSPACTKKSRFGWTMELWTARFGGSSHKRMRFSWETT